MLSEFINLVLIKSKLFSVFFVQNNLQNSHSKHMQKCKQHTERKTSQYLVRFIPDPLLSLPKCHNRQLEANGEDKDKLNAIHFLLFFARYFSLFFVKVQMLRFPLGGVLSGALRHG